MPAGKPLALTYEVALRLSSATTLASEKEGGAVFCNKIGEIGDPGPRFELSRIDLAYRRFARQEGIDAPPLFWEVAL